MSKYEMKKQSRKFEQFNSYGKRKFVALTLMKKKMNVKLKKQPPFKPQHGEQFWKTILFFEYGKNFTQKNLKRGWKPENTLN